LTNVATFSLVYNVAKEDQEDQEDGN